MAKWPSDDTRLVSPTAGHLRHTRRAGTRPGRTVSRSRMPACHRSPSFPSAIAIQSIQCHDRQRLEEELTQRRTSFSGLRTFPRWLCSRWPLGFLQSIINGRGTAADRGYHPRTACQPWPSPLWPEPVILQVHQSVFN